MIQVQLVDLARKSVRAVPDRQRGSEVKSPDKGTRRFARNGLVRILPVLRHKVGKMDSWQDSSSNRKRHIGDDVGGGAQVFRECGRTDESGCRWGYNSLLKVSRELS